MKKILVLALVLVTVCIVSVCSHQNNESAINSIPQQDTAKRDKTIDEYKKKYSAIDYNTENKNIRFSAEMLDKYRGKNMYTSFYYIDDVFYSDNDMFMYVEGLGENFMLKITPEQFSKIKTFENDFTFSDFHVIFCLENITSVLPSLSANFCFDISDLDGDVLASEDISTSFDSKIIQGTLIDILELK